MLCVYYSRTGNTRAAMEEIAKTLGAELVELQDSVDRSGWGGWLRCGLDAMRRTLPAVKCPARFPLTDYRLVIVGSPVWAVLTRGSEDKNEEIFEQMDRYTPCGHRTAASLRSGSVGYAFWLEEFLRQTQEFLQTTGR